MAIGIDITDPSGPEEERGQFIRMGVVSKEGGWQPDIALFPCGENGEFKERADKLCEIFRRALREADLAGDLKL